MKVPHDAEIEIRCDCGSLIGYTVTRHGQRTLILGYDGFWGKQHEELSINSGDNLLEFLRDPEMGHHVRCNRTSRNHARVIRAEHLDLSLDGERRKVLLRPE